MRTHKTINPDDLLQPNSPRFKKVYGHDPVEDVIKKKEEKIKMEENRKAKLEEKYWKREKKRMYPWRYPEVKEGGLHTHDRKAIEKRVLKEDKEW